MVTFRASMASRTILALLVSLLVLGPNSLFDQRSSFCEARSLRIPSFRSHVSGSSFLQSIQNTVTSNVTDAVNLLAFRDGLYYTTDDKPVLADWNFTLLPNVCDWPYLSCSVSGRVTAVNLTGITFSGPFSPVLGSLDQLRTLVVNGSSYEAWSGSGLTGPIPPEIGNLTYLKVLDLTDNFLVGSLPFELGNLVNLVVLNLGLNNFTGEIPSSLQKLSKLQLLTLGPGYALSGSIPTWLPEMPTLVRLHLGGNNFSGSIPETFGSFLGTHLFLFDNALTGSIPESMGNMRNVTQLVLSKNPLTGTLPKSFHRLNRTLSRLEISNTLVSGPIPEEWGGLFSKADIFSYHSYYFDITTAINSLTLSQNRLNGSIPDALGNLQGLALLDLSGNDFSGPIPSSFANFDLINTLFLEQNALSGEIPDIFYLSNASLSGVDLSFNNLSGPIPPSLAASKSLIFLSLSSNQLTGPVPKGLPSVSSLSYLDLSDNLLSGKFPSSLSTGITTFWIYNNNFSGPLPSTLVECDQLASIDISENQFTGVLSSALLSFPNLTSINVAGNKLSGQIPTPSGAQISSLAYLNFSRNSLEGRLTSSFSGLTSLNFLDVSSNKLNSTLPSSLGTLTGLQTLDLSNNRFSGALPSSLSNLSRLEILRAGANNFTSGIPSVLANVTSLQSLNLSSNQFSSSIPAVLGSLQKLTLLDLSHNSLNGPIPGDLGNLSHLLSLDLSYNQLTGDIPVLLASLAALQTLNLSDNYLTGVIPAGNLSRFNSSSFLQNTGLCGSPLSSCAPPPAGPVSPSSSLSTGAIAGISAGAAACLVIVLFMACLVCYWRSHGGEDQDDGEMFIFGKLDSPLTLRIILESTENFSPSKVLGEGGFGSVYKVTLKDGTNLAVKRLNEGSSQGLLELRTEMDVLGKVKHKNVVVLVGAYIGSRESLLVYEFLPYGDLEGHLYENKKNMFNDWPIRLNAIIGSARGMKYLHHDMEISIIHRDLKPANILFTHDMQPKVADFGLAKKIDMEVQEHLSTTVSGTIGYLAPEYATSGHLTTKSDVFAFGIVMLQVLTGKRPGEDSLGDMGLAKWVHTTWKKQGLKAVTDPRVAVTEEEEAQVIGTLRLGLMCTSKVPNNRPTMDEVVYILENLDLFEDGVGSRPQESFSSGSFREESNWGSRNVSEVGMNPNPNLDSYKGYSMKSLSSKSVSGKSISGKSLTYLRARSDNAFGEEDEEMDKKNMEEEVSNDLDAMMAEFSDLSAPPAARTPAAAPAPAADPVLRSQEGHSNYSQVAVQCETEAR
eukprot:TRINITY_DN6704_c0_g2_i2.p1 TRINITY_DN6704_c0_g2~~TRINITY_DN6704_c0_g2_i2.p1  ORF type:complete len:1285 (+),score=190.67 TRINITY_DN6704_c0_g2_i2:164-4018(+)